MKTSVQLVEPDQLVGFPMGSVLKRFLPDPSSKQIQAIHDPNSKSDSSVLNRVSYKKLCKKSDSSALQVTEHLRLGHKITETVKGKLSLGARILQAGGLRKVYNKLFKVQEGEKLLKAAQCYLSTTAGPMSGLLFISTEKIAFCSDRSIKFSSENGEYVRLHYKVVIPIEKIKRINQAESVKKPSHKYIEVVTVDDFDFWFMGFLNYKKKLRFDRNKRKMMKPFKQKSSSSDGARRHFKM